MMQKSLAAVAVFVCGALALAAPADSAAAERRVALVIGNSAYKIAALEIPNAKNDAEDVAAALTALGFDVLLQTDADQAVANKAIQQFARQAVGADAALFYYAGHAVQYQGHNYLLPVDADVKDEISLPFETIAVDNVRAVLDRSNGVKIMVLDACRSNPVADRLAKIAPASPPVALDERARGLERIEKSEGLIVAYATSPGDVALDGQDRNSPFTKAFLRRLNEPGLEIGTMFRRIASDVNAATGGRQRPETYISLVNEYYLNQNDRIAWDKIKTTDDPASLRDFIEHFPSSFYALEARYRLQAVERAIAEAKERALREAEIVRREKDLAAEEALARQKADADCQNDRAALAAAGPRDADGLRALAAGGCDEVRGAAQKRLTALRSLLAAEAEACRRDNGALAAIDPRDLAAFRAFVERAACVEAETAARAKIAGLEADIAAQAELCRREEGEVRALAERGAPADFEALRRRADCPTTTAVIDRELRNIALAAQAVCNRDGGALAAISERDASALRGLIARTSCETVKTAASVRLAELETVLAREAEGCRREDGELKGFVERGAAADIEALKARAQCAATIAAVDRGLRELAAAASVACAQDNATLNGIGPRDAAALRNLVDRNPCDAVKTSAGQRLLDLKASLAHEAEICQRDEAQWKGMANSGSRVELEGLHQHAECASVVLALERRLTDLKTICRNDDAALSALGPRDAEGLRGLMADIRCDDVRANAQQRLSKLETLMAHEAEICQRDEVEWKATSASGDHTAVTALRQRAECLSVVVAIDRALADWKTACGREQTTLSAIGPSDADAVRSFLSRATCDEAKIAARAKLAKIEAEMARQEERCRQDEADLASLKSEGVDAREKLIDLKRRLTCASLRPALEAALEQMPPPPAPPEFNTNAQIRFAQTQLQRIGCLPSHYSGKLDSKTQQALKRYFEAKGDSEPAIAEIRVTDEFLSALKEEKPDLCAPAKDTAPEPSVDVEKLLRRPKKENVVRYPPQDELRQKAAEPRPAKEKVARPAPAEKNFRLAKPRQPEPAAAPAAPAAQSSASSTSRPRGGGSPMGVGF
jgi:hypothetical protein